MGNVPAIPLPHPDVVSPSRVVDESKGLYKAEPAPKPKPAARRDADSEIRDATNRPKYVTAPVEASGKSHAAAAERDSLRRRRRADDSDVLVRDGRGHDAGGLGFTGAAGGDFGSRFSWYVEAVQRRISSNWLQSTVDPSVAAAPRVVVTFTILRDGTVTNIQVTQSSNNYSVDTSAVRAVQDSSPLRLAAGIFGIECECGILVRFSAVREFASESPRHREDGINCR